MDLDRSDYAGPSSRIRVLEQTTFLNDETFEPHSARCPDYATRAVLTELESKAKLMYICRVSAHRQVIAYFSFLSFF